MPYTLVTEPSKAQDLLPVFLEKKVLALSLQLNDQNKPLSLQIGDTNKQYIIDLRTVPIEIFKGYLESKNHKKIIHKASSLWSAINKEYKIDTEHIRCTYFAESLLQNGLFKKDLSLKFAIRNKLHTAFNDYLETSFNQFTGEYTTEQMEYLSDCIKYLIPLCQEQCDDLIALNIGKTWVLECEAIAPFESMCLSGFKMDKKKWLSLVEENEFLAKKSKDKLDFLAKNFVKSDMYGNAMINYSSPSQVLELLRAMRVTVKKYDPKTKQEVQELISATNAKELDLIEDEEVITLLQDYRSYQRLVTTYGVKLIGNTHPETNKIYFKLDQLGTVTGRPASLPDSMYNPLNIPKDYRYRSCFIADENFVIETDDFSNYELRILADLSRDPSFVEAFTKGVDFHSYTAKKLFKSDRYGRDHIKPINFGIIYGMHTSALYNEFRKLKLGFTYDQVREFHRIYTKVEFKTACDYLWQQGEKAVREGSVETVGGRRRLFQKMEIDKSQAFQLEHKRRKEGANFVIQGTGSDIIKRSLRLIYDAIKSRGFRSEIKNTPYDEIVTMTHKDESDEFVQIKREQMKKAAEEYIKTIPIVVDGKVDLCWKK